MSKGHILPSLPGYDRWLCPEDPFTWATYLEKESRKCPHMTHNHLTYPGPNRENCTPVSVLGSLPAHISPLNTGYGGTAAPHYRRITPCEHPRGLFAPARPFTHIGRGGVPQGIQQNWERWISHFSRIGTRVRQVVVRHMWALPRYFFETCCPDAPPRRSQRSCVAL